ncbi:hypothetical protein GCM10010442_34230 [Kitasatospora kifunensis]
MTMTRGGHRDGPAQVTGLLQGAVTTRTSGLVGPRQVILRSAVAWSGRERPWSAEAAMAVQAGLAHQADGEVAQGGHRGGRVCGADLGGVLSEGHVAHVVRGFHAAVALDERGRAGGVGGLAGG